MGCIFIEMGPGDRIPVLPFFDLVMVWNPGISYGLFPAHGILGTALLTLFSVAAVAGLGWWLWRAERGVLAAALGWSSAGYRKPHRPADLRQGCRFFHFYVRGYDWYVFNIADARSRWACGAALRCVAAAGTDGCRPPKRKMRMTSDPRDSSSRGAGRAGPVAHRLRIHPQARASPRSRLTNLRWSRNRRSSFPGFQPPATQAGRFAHQPDLTDRRRSIRAVWRRSGRRGGRRSRQLQPGRTHSACQFRRRECGSFDQKADRFRRKGYGSNGRQLHR